MRRNLIGLAALAFVVATTAACSHRPRGVVQDETRAVGPAAGEISRIQSKGWVDVSVAVGAKQGISVNCDRTLLPKIHTRVEGSTLVIESDPVHDLSFGTGDPRCAVRVSVPKLVSVSANGSGDLFVRGEADGLSNVAASGSGNVEVDAARAGTFELVASGSGDVAIRSLDAEDVSAIVRGSGDVRTAGKAKAFRLNVSGSGDIDAHDLKTERGVVRSRGSSDVKLFVSRRADIETTGSGDVTVLGHPAEREAKVRGSGAVRWE